MTNKREVTKTKKVEGIKRKGEETKKGLNLKQEEERMVVVEGVMVKKMMPKVWGKVRNSLFDSRLFFAK